MFGDVMTFDYFFILLIIALLSIVQSFFGMGILIFGTPTLLLVGYSFPETLSYLLPASWAIAFLQVLTAGPLRVSISRSLYFLCLPAIGVGIFFSTSPQIISVVNIIIGTTLIISAMINFSKNTKNIISSLLKKNLVVYHFVMGIVHGLTNLGGALLVILAKEMQSDKNKIRYTVAYYYLAFNSVQILFLAFIMGHLNILISHSFTAAVSLSTYFFIGNKVFDSVSNKFFNSALSLFIGIYGVIILLKL